MQAVRPFTDWDKKTKAQTKPYWKKLKGGKPEKGRVP